MKRYDVMGNVVSIEDLVISYRKNYIAEAFVNGILTTMRYDVKPTASKAKDDLVKKACGYYKKGNE